MLSIDYFNYNNETKTDKSNWIASITCLSGCNNGTGNTTGLNFDSHTTKFKSVKSHGFFEAGLWSGLAMIGFSAVFANNWLQGPMHGRRPGSVTGDREPEVRNKMIKTGVLTKKKDNS